MKTWSLGRVASSPLRLILSLATACLVIACAGGMGGRGSRLPEILADHPTKPYVEVTRIDTSMVSTDAGTMTEQAALPLIRKQASEAGADAVIDLTREAYVNGKLRATAHYGKSDWTSQLALVTMDDLHGSGDAAAARKAIMVVYRATGIKYQ